MAACTNYRTEYLLRGVLGVQNSDEFAYDMCPNHQCPVVFGRQQSFNERRKHPNQRCENCGSQRFVKKNGVITAARRCVVPPPLFAPVVRAVCIETRRLVPGVMDTTIVFDISPPWRRAVM